jgi:hypothetical protein
MEYQKQPGLLPVNCRKMTKPVEFTKEAWYGLSTTFSKKKTKIRNKGPAG